MNNKIKLISINPLEIELLEDFKKGSKINISSCFDEEQEAFKNVLDQYINNHYNQIFNQLKQEQEKELIEKTNFAKEQAISKQKEIDEKQINDLKEKLIKANADNEKIKKETELEAKIKYQDQINSLENKIEQISKIKENDIKLAKTNLEKELTLKFNEEKDKYTKEINNLKIEVLDQENKHKEKIVNLKHEHENLLKQKEDEINELKRNKNLLGTKALGQELENWCEREIKTKLIDAVGNDGSVTLNKFEHNQEKADFYVIFKNPNMNNQEIKDDFKVILEMKTEALDTKEVNRKSNESHLNKLVKDAEKEKGNIAILVTELEKEDNFLIRRVNNLDYHTDLEIFMVRPQLLVYLLSILRIIYLKYISIKQIQDISFKDKEEIIKEFAEFKNSLLDKTAKNIKNNLAEIIQLAGKIHDNATEISEKANLVLEKQFKTFISKFEDYNIENKVIKKIEKLEKLETHESDYNDLDASDNHTLNITKKVTNDK